MRGLRMFVVLCFSLPLALTASVGQAAAAAKDESRIGTGDFPRDGIGTMPLTPLPAPGVDQGIDAPLFAPPPDQDNQPYITPETDLPVIESVELTPDMAVRALDAFNEVRDKYNDQGLQNYVTLEEFVDKTTAGKQLEADIKTFGFKNITEWSLAIASVGFAYDAVTGNTESDIRLEIDAIRTDTALNQDERERMIASLEAMLPSENNKRIVKDLLNHPEHRSKLRLLDERE